MVEVDPDLAGVPELVSDPDVVPRPRPDKAWIDPEGYLRLPPPQFFRYRTLLAELAIAEMSASAARQELQNFRLEVAAATGVDPNAAEIDPVTGRMTVVPEA